MILTVDIDPFDLEEIAATEDSDKVSGAIYTPPFRVVIDVNEGLAYRFADLKTDGAKAGRTIVVSTITKALYQMGKESVQVNDKWYHKGLADYSIDGLEEHIQIERKSLEDLYGTLGGRRDDFEAEIARLNMCDFAAVVIEAGWHDILFNPPEYSRLAPKVVSRTITSWSMRYPHVHWFTCAGRAHAEPFTFRLLEMFWRQWEKRKPQK